MRWFTVDFGYSPPNSRSISYNLVAGAMFLARVSHYAIMGYNMQPFILLKKTVPAIIRNLKDEAVDVVVRVAGIKTSFWASGGYSG